MSEGFVLLIVLLLSIGVPGVYFVSKEHDAAVKLGEQIRSLMADKKYTEARDLLERAFTRERFPKGDLRHLQRYDLAQCYIQEGLYEDALSELRIVARVYEKNKRIPSWSAEQVASGHASVREYMAQCYEQTGDDAERDRERLRAGELYIASGMVAHASFLFGSLRRDIGDYERAVTSFETALAHADGDHNPDQMRFAATWHLGMALVQTGRSTEASIRLREAVSLCSESFPSGELHASLAEVCDDMGETEEALVHLEKAFADEAMVGYARLSKARILINAGRLGDARTEAIAARGSSDRFYPFEPFVNEATAAQMQGDWFAAETLLVQCLELCEHPSSRVAEANRAYIRYEQAILWEERGRYAGAVAALNEAEPGLIWHPRMACELATFRMLLSLRAGGSTPSAGEIEELENRVDDAVSRFSIEREGLIYYQFSVANLAQCWCAIGEVARGRMLFEKGFGAMTRVIYRAKYLFHIAKCHESEGNIEKAIGCYEAATNCDTEERHRVLAGKRLKEIRDR